MLTNVFEQLADDIVPSFVSREDVDAVSHLCGVLIPSRDEHDFPGLEETKPLVEVALAESSQGAELFLIWIQSTWFPDTRVNRHLGPTKDLREHRALVDSLVGQRCLVNAGGEIRHLGACKVSRDSLSESIDFAARYQRRCFLIVASSADPDVVLKQTEEGLVRSSDDKALEDFVYPRLCRAFEELDAVVVRSVGWLEEGCEVRFLCIGTHEALDRLSLESG
ncbi:MAG: hypothetical protein AB7O52_19930 [Planctomycetota bacterium]